MRSFVGVLNKMKKLVKVVSTCWGVALGLGFIVSAIEKTVSAKRQDRICVHKPYGVYEKYLKRPIDFALSLGAITFLTPLLLVTGILVCLKLGNPVFFIQERPGLDGEIFKLYKFRTMTDEKDAEGNLLSDEDRLTAFGQKLRSTSIDELPELLNIIKGNMSLVGPRPLLVEYLPRYNAYQARRHEVRPGLTGLAQTKGRNSLSWEEKFNDDVNYVDHITFMGDIKIILDTVRTVIKHEGIHSKDSATMEVFMGSESEF